MDDPTVGNSSVSAVGSFPTSVGGDQASVSTLSHNLPQDPQDEVSAIANSDGSNRPLSAAAAAVPDRNDDTDTSTQNEPRVKKRKTKRH